VGEEEANYGFKLKAQGCVETSAEGDGEDIDQVKYFAVEVNEEEANDSGADEDEEMDGGGGDSGEDDPDKILSKIWRQFPHDVMAQAPNKQSAMEGSYLLLDVAERSYASHKDSRSRT